MKRVTAILMIPILVFGMNTSTVKAEENEINEKCIVSIAVDVSGSMQNTDVKRDVPETIKMLADICDSNDHISVIAYNDDVVYSSGLVDTSNSENVRQLKEDLDALSYEGDTDNGLGLIGAVKVITDSEVEYDRAIVILISDGNTDLPHSSLGRTVADSEHDVETGAELAKQCNIPIHVVEYANGYAIDSGTLSVAASSTGGGVTVVNEPMQFVQVMLNLFFSSYNGGKTSYLEEKADEKLNRTKFEGAASNKERVYYILYSQEKIADIEVLDKEYQIECETVGRYAVIGAHGEPDGTFEVIYNLEKSGSVLLGTIRAEKLEKQEAVVKEVEVEVPMKSALPIGIDFSSEEYTSREKLQLDVNTIFEDDDIVKFALEAQDARVSLIGSTLNLDISKAGTISTQVRAYDAAGNSAVSNVTIEVISSWKRYQTLLIGGIVLLIAMATVAVCAVIIKKLLFQEQKKTRTLSGELTARFVDIKSKNDLDSVKWNLRDYPPAGVSLEELFHSKNIKEELKDIDKVCFYPGEYERTIQLVHCIEGGVFVGDHHVRANTPVCIKHGDRIYISIAENASEIELTYTEM